MAVVSITEATIAWGFNPITSLSGTTVSAWRGLVLVLASLGVYALPLLAITTIGVLLSTVTRNSAGAVVGALMIALLMQLIGILPGVGAIKPYLLTTQFDAWHGFLRTPIDWAPITRGVGLGALRRRWRSRAPTSCSCAGTSPAGSRRGGASQAAPASAPAEPAQHGVMGGAAGRNRGERDPRQPEYRPHSLTLS